MENAKLQKFLIVLSIFLIFGFVIIKNFDKMPFKKVQDKVEDNNEIENPDGNDFVCGDSMYGVSSVNPIASKVGMEVLEHGGNAVDAAIAMSFALNVVDPQNSGIGGGGGMLIMDGLTGEKAFYDYYVSSGDVDPKNNIGIPGFLKGMELINKEMGNKELSEIIQYAIDIAEDGVEVTEGYADVLARNSHIASVYPPFEKDGEVLKEGDIVYQPELIETLKEVKEHGSDIFYNGEHEISKNFLEITGISQESLKNYEVYKREPLEIEYRGYNIIAPPAPFSGLTLLQNLLIEEQVDIPEHDFENIEYNNNMRDILKYTGKENRKTIGDPNFVNIDYNEKLDIDYLMYNYNDNIEPDDYYEEPEAVSTTGFTVIDKDGTMAAVTNTLSSYWGSFIISDGIIYNNTMKNFTKGKNKFEFNKRPKTGIAPTIITNDSSHKEVIATSGGAKIPGFLFHLIVNSKKDNLDIQMANDMERMYYLRNQMHFESEAPYTKDENRVINFNGKYIEFDSSDNWGMTNGIEVKEDGTINSHVDKRGYFDGECIYSNGDKKVYE